MCFALLSPGPRELSTVLDSTPPTLPLVIVVDEAAALPHPEGLARAAQEGLIALEGEAGEFIVEMHYPGEVTVLAVGPLTNVATAIRRSPQTAERPADTIW